MCGIVSTHSCQTSLYRQLIPLFGCTFRNYGITVGTIQLGKNDSPNDYKEDFQNFSRNTKKVKHPDSEGESEESQDEDSYSAFLSKLNSRNCDRNNGRPKVLGLGGLQLLENEPPYEVNCHNSKFTYLRGNSTNDSLYSGSIKLERCH